MKAILGEIVYVEPSYDAEANAAIADNYGWMSDRLELAGYRFVYYPRLLSDSQSEELLRYHFPDFESFGKVGLDELMQIYAGYYEPDGLREPMFVEVDWSGRIVECHAISDRIDDNSFEAFVRSLESRVPLDAAIDIKYCCCQKSRSAADSPKIVEEVHSVYDFLCDSIACESPILQDADSAFDEEAYQLEAEVQTLVNKLRRLGYTEQRLAKLLQLETPQLSHLLITEDFRLILTDYREQEIKMSSLPKALYFLFLRHPEGLMFKGLVDYQDELMELYHLVSNRESLDKMRGSICDLVDCTSNSVNEKCSRIRSAFIRHFDESLMKPYFVTKGADRLKRVTFDRDLLIDATGLIKK